MNAIIISASSDIGTALAQRWRAKGHTVYGTYRTPSAATKELQNAGVHLLECDLANVGSTKAACAELGVLCPAWDVLVLGPGLQDPVGAFDQCDFDEWEGSVRVNFSGQMRIIHSLLPTRRKRGVPEPLVLLFAGGGTNNATVNYSAYTVSKIALIKMCELLDAEIPDARFAILGPGWVKTKIHDSTLKAADKAGANYQKTLQKLASSECTPMDKVLDCCDWLIHSSRAVISGRNFSVVFDRWGDKRLDDRLRADSDMYKLRRHANDWGKS